ncbi:MAG: DoxX family protein [Clostridia bacterium]|nr:DoxX family protein [Clostridia bacterium]
MEASFVQKIFQVAPSQSALLLRLALGVVFFAHGAQKLLGWFGGYGWSGTVGFLTSLGIPAPLAGLVILIEFFGGLAILLGVLTRPAALGLALISLGAIFKVHLANGFFLGEKAGIEFVFVLLFLSLYLVVKGAGTLSIDKAIADKLAVK